MPAPRHLHVGIFVGATVAAHLLATQAGKPFLLTQLTMSAYYTLAVVGLSLLMGYAGQISLGHAAFFAIGGYTSAVLTTLDLGPQRAAAVVATLARLGVLEAFSVSLLPAAYKDAISVAVLLAILFVRPSGLFGSAEVARLEAKG